jgi:hypothetical protein
MNITPEVARQLVEVRRDVDIDWTHPETVTSQSTSGASTMGERLPDILSEEAMALLRGSDSATVGRVVDRIRHAYGEWYGAVYWGREAREVFGPIDAPFVRKAMALFATRGVIPIESTELDRLVADRISGVKGIGDVLDESGVEALRQTLEGNVIDGIAFCLTRHLLDAIKNTFQKQQEKLGHRDLLRLVDDATVGAIFEAAGGRGISVTRGPATVHYTPHRTGRTTYQGEPIFRISKILSIEGKPEEKFQTLRAEGEVNGSHALV